MSFEKIKLTSKGRALLAKTGAGGTLTFTKIKMGDGQITSQVIENMTSLINEVVSLRCNAPQRSGDFVTVTANFKNAAAQDAFTGDGTKKSFKLSAAPTALTSVKVAGTETTGYTYANGTLTFSSAPSSGDEILVTYNLSGFYFREIGFFASDPDEGEIMFAYQNAGSLAEYIAAASSEVIEKTIGATFTFSDSTAVTVEVDDSLLLMPISQGQYKTELLEAASELTETDKMPVYDVSSHKNVQATLSEIASLFVIVKNNISVPTSAWVSDVTYVDYPYRASIAIDGCTANHIPEVTFALADATSDNFAPIAETYDGGVYIYATEVPSEAITVPTIKLTKVVE